MDWLEKKNPFNNLRKFLLVLSFLAPVNLLLILFNVLGFIPSFWMISSFLYFALYMLYAKYIKGTLDDAVPIYDEFRKLYRIMHFLENYGYNNNLSLKEFCSSFLSKDKPSVQLKGIKKIISTLQMKGNPVVWLAFCILFPADFYYAYKLEKYKKSISGKLPLWLKTWYNLEALNSLANLAYLNPDFNLPVIKNPSGIHDINFDIKKAGHPLIPADKKVCNDFLLNSAGEIALITGSNMSGKSTFLRTIGTNICLAYSGGPVNAQSMNISLIRLFTCIKVSDSVIDGISYFYSEVKRLKQLLDELNKNDERPVLFLIDEIFKGTNNFERLEGSKSYIKYLAGKNGTGIISTHDLELVRIADEITQFKNYHFREEVINNKMEFDYLLHDGPCPTTNALKIMKMEGLPVDDELLKK
jgi:energy-coupling factor transporter ATP-binding protein EcfA2